jgi:hypothetical protein
MTNKDKRIKELEDALFFCLPHAEFALQGQMFNKGIARARDVLNNKGKKRENHMTNKDKPRITGITSDGAMFSVSFPDGFDGQPEVTIKGLEFEGLNSQADCALALSNWFSDYSIKLN